MGKWRKHFGGGTVAYHLQNECSVLLEGSMDMFGLFHRQIDNLMSVFARCTFLLLVFPNYCELQKERIPDICIQVVVNYEIELIYSHLYLQMRPRSTDGNSREEIYILHSYHSSQSSIITFKKVIRIFKPIHTNITAWPI